MRYLITSLCLIFAFQLGNAQGVQGKITNTKGEEVPFATVYAEELYIGTTSNVEGVYHLKLKPGNYKVSFKYMGYKTKTVAVEVDEDFKNIDVVLEDQQYMIPEVKVSATGEDPAYYVMRKAIGMSQYYQNQISEYKSRVYTKGTGVIENIPFLLEKTLKEEGIEEGKVILMENITDLHFTAPDKMEQKVISMRSKGFDGADMDPLEFFSLSLYDTDDMEIISPLSSEAFAVYKFKLEGAFEDKGFLINKIKVTPKRKGTDVLDGYLFIVEDFWSIYSADLKLEQRMFNLKIRQQYEPVRESVWMPISHELKVAMKAMGFKGRFTYIASVNDYEVSLNPKIDHSIIDKIKENWLLAVKEQEEVMAQLQFEIEEQKKAKEKKTPKEKTERQKEIETLLAKDDLKNKDSRRLQRLMRKEMLATKPVEPLEIVDPVKVEVSDSAKNKSEDYWAKVRPIPLTEEEKLGMAIDSTKKKKLKPKKKKTAKDSTRKSRFKWVDPVLFGKRFSKKDKDYSVYVPGILNIEDFNYNTVEGLEIGKDISYNQKLDSGKYMWNRLYIGYGVSSELPKFAYNFSYRYDGIKRASFGFGAGRKVRDFGGGPSKMINIVNTLILRDNLLKLYREDYIRAYHKFDISNGLVLNTSVKYAERKQLFNNVMYSFHQDPDEKFTPNAPENLEMNPDVFSDNKLLLTNINIDYTPRYRYRIRKGRKYMAYSKYPTFSLNYKQAYGGWITGDAQYSHLRFSVRQSLDLGRFGNFRYRVHAGAFLGKENMHFSDFNHFRTNPSELISTSDNYAFRWLNHYKYSTSDKYLEVHTVLTDNLIVLKRLPILNKSLMQERLYFNYLTTPDFKNYMEFGYGLDQIFLMFNAEIFVSFHNFDATYTGFKIGVPLDSGF